MAPRKTTGGKHEEDSAKQRASTPHKGNEIIGEGRKAVSGVTGG